MDPKEQRYWQAKWEESTNVVSVMEALLSSQAIQIAELKAKIKDSAKLKEAQDGEILQLSRCVASCREKLKLALGRRNIARRKAA